MDLLEIRHRTADLLAEKLSLEPGRTLFINALPPGVQEGLTLSIAGFRPRTPGNAAECTLEITGTFEEEAAVFRYLEQLQTLFEQPCPAEFLFWQITGDIRQSIRTGEPMDRNVFQLTATVAFV